MARAHPVAAIVVELACEEGMVVSLRRPPRLRLAPEFLLDPVPGLRVDDRRMESVVDLPFVTQPSDIDRVRQNPVEMASRDRGPAGPSASPAHSDWRANVLGVEDGLEADHAGNFEITAEQGADELALVFDDVEGAVFNPVAERRPSRCLSASRRRPCVSEPSQPAKFRFPDHEMERSEPRLRVCQIERGGRICCEWIAVASISWPRPAPRSAPAVRWRAIARTRASAGRSGA